MIVAAALDRGVLGGRRFGLGVLQRRESHRADDSVATRKLACSVGRVVLGAVAVQKQKEAGECTRGARLCCAMASARRAMGSPMRKRKGAGRGGAACRARRGRRAVFVALAAKALSGHLRGKAADPSPLSVLAHSGTLSTHSLY